MGRKFDPDQYETVKARKARFKSDYPDGRIVVANYSDKPTEYAFFMATIYGSREEQADRLPLSTGNALELRDWELAVSNQEAVRDRELHELDRELRGVGNRPGARQRRVRIEPLEGRDAEGGASLRGAVRRSARRRPFGASGATRERAGAEGAR